MGDVSRFDVQQIMQHKGQLFAFCVHSIGAGMESQTSDNYTETINMSSIGE